MPFSQTPTYNLKVVLKETGITADTLRAWERRYGLPMPERTPGKHRLYSQYDIETVKWLMRRQSEGLSISRAVELWKEQIASGADPLADSAKQAVMPTHRLNLEATRSDWINACLQFDTLKAEQILNEAFAVNSVELTCTEVMMHGLHELGELWLKNQVSVQQEHFASAIAMRRLEALINAAPAPSRPESILVTCPPNEWHVFPTLLLSLFLRRRGWNVVYLGANVPTDHMEETIDSVHPKLVILSAQTLLTAVSLREMVRMLNRKEIQSAYGGRVFNYMPGIREVIPAHFLGNTIEYSVPQIENLVINPSPVPSEREIDGHILKLAAEYRQKRSSIEAVLLDILKSRGHPADYINTAVFFFGDTLTAALDLGDIHYISPEIEWVVNMLVEHNISVFLLPAFLDAYAAAVQQVMGAGGKPIADWISMENEKLKA
jgi:DNA-binding transcriptional MerR regulator